MLAASLNYRDFVVCQHAYGRRGGELPLAPLAGGAGEINLGQVVTRNIRLQGVTVGSRALFEDMVRAIELHGARPSTVIFSPSRT
ncbi:MAG: hypothetical protein ACTSXZ_09045 [Alphaproteobacteria bacterium]